MNVNWPAPGPIAKVSFAMRNLSSEKRIAGFDADSSGSVTMSAFIQRPGGSQKYSDLPSLDHNGSSAPTLETISDCSSLGIAGGPPGPLGMRLMYNSMRPEASERYASERPSGEMRAIGSLALVISSGSICPF